MCIKCEQYRHLIHSKDVDQFYTPRLTPRQKQVARLLRDGWDNQSIAKEVGTSVVTVKRHLSDIYRMMRVSNREELVAVLLLPLDSPLRAAIEDKNRNVY